MNNQGLRGGSSTDGLAHGINPRVQPKLPPTPGAESVGLPIEGVEGEEPKPPVEKRKTTRKAQTLVM